MEKGKLRADGREEQVAPEKAWGGGCGAREGYRNATAGRQEGEEVSSAEREETHRVE